MLVSSQIAFWSSVLIIIASFDSYRNMVKKRLETIGEIPAEERDATAKIEDPYDLYDEEDSDISEKSVKELIDEERLRMKKQKRSPVSIARDSAAMFSLTRLGAYLVLVVGFFYLRGSGNWHAGAYLLSLALPVTVIVALLINAESVDG